MGAGDVIEPMLKSQWFVRCGDMGEKARVAVQDGTITMQPPQQVCRLCDVLNQGGIHYAGFNIISQP
jgi:valyl-tRNA synthetase